MAAVRQGHGKRQWPMINGGYSQNGAGLGLRGTFAHGSMLDVWLAA